MNKNRVLFSMEELNDWINKRLVDIPRFKKCKVSVQYRLQESDDTGCNWSPDLVVNLEHDVSLSEISPYLEKIVQEARLKINLK